MTCWPRRSPNNPTTNTTTVRRSPVLLPMLIPVPTRRYKPVVSRLRIPQALPLPNPRCITTFRPRWYPTGARLKNIQIRPLMNPLHRSNAHQRRPRRHRRAKVSTRSGQLEASPWSRYLAAQHSSSAVSPPCLPWDWWPSSVRAWANRHLRHRRHSRRRHRRHRLSRVQHRKIRCPRSRQTRHRPRPSAPPLHRRGPSPTSSTAHTPTAAG